MKTKKKFDKKKAYLLTLIAATFLAYFAAGSAFANGWWITTIVMTIAGVEVHYLTLNKLVELGYKADWRRKWNM